ncbi:MAG: aminopeptidase [Cyanobacteria bacterium RYN_339]|nr:aminopeptidase [Cyanobacteria bacterium RYN_339]
MKVLRPLLFAATLSLQGCYVLQQGAGQMQLLSRREPVAKVAPKLAPELQAKLALIPRVKQYAEETIGLRHTTNYEQYVALDRDAVTYVVSAAPPDKLEAYTWWFPIIGAVPYKGFFDRADAVKEQDAMKAQGYDTILRGVPAFSTLGWLPDPIYSPFLGYDVPTLVNVVIHETTHATLFLAGQASFNEGFATFVGNEGALGFLQQAYGAGSPEVAAARAEIADNGIFTEFIQAVSRRLDTLYNGPATREQKLIDRERVFAEARDQFARDFVPRLRGHQFRHFPQSAFNNASLISYRTYYNRLDRFEKAFEKQGRDLKATVIFFKDQVAKASDPEKFLDDYVK